MDNLLDSSVMAPVEEARAKSWARALDAPVRKNPGQLWAEKAPGRNKPCPCGSGVKYKKCCARPAPKKEIKYKSISDSYTPDQQEARKAFIKTWGWDPSPSQLAKAMIEGAEATKEMVVNRLREVAVEKDTSHAAYIAAVQKHGILLSRLNEKLYSDEEREAFLTTVRENLPDDPGQIEDGDGTPRPDG